MMIFLTENNGDRKKCLKSYEQLVDVLQEQNGEHSEELVETEQQWVNNLFCWGHVQEAIRRSELIV